MLASTELIRMEMLPHIIDSLKWPVVVVIVAVILRSQLGHAIGRLKRIKYKEFDAEFAEILGDVSVQESAEEPPTEEGEEFAPELYEQRKGLVALGKISQRAAILEAWMLLENTIRGLAEEKKLHPHPTTAGTFRELQRVSPYLSGSYSERINDLRNLRNLAAHEADFQISDEQLNHFIYVCVHLAASIRAQVKADPEHYRPLTG